MNARGLSPAAEQSGAAAVPSLPLQHPHPWNLLPRLNPVLLPLTRPDSLTRPTCPKIHMQKFFSNGVALRVGFQVTRASPP